jgi:ankyrin repeat protein
VSFESYMSHSDLENDFHYALYKLDYARIQKMVDRNPELLNHHWKSIYYPVYKISATPIHRAVARNEPELVILLATLLAKHGVDPNRVFDEKGAFYSTLLHIAMEHRHPQLIPLLLTIPGVDVNEKDRSGYTVLALWCLDIQRPTYFHVPPLQILSCLLEAGADASIAVRGSGETPLHMTTDIIPVTLGIKVMKMLITNFPGGVDVRDNKDDATPLIMALVRNYGEEKILMIDVLIENGSDVNVRSMRYGSPLHIAAGDNNMIMVQKLLRYGANPFLLDHNGKTPREACMFRNKCTAFLQIFEERVIEFYRKNLVRRKLAVMSGLHPRGKDSLLHLLVPDILSRITAEIGGSSPYTPAQLEMSSQLAYVVEAVMNSIDE